MTHAYPLALGVTLASEAVGAAALALALGRSAWRWSGVCVAVNLVTHPTFWLGLPHLPAEPAPRLLVAEGLVVIAEALVYAPALGLPPLRALGVSLLLNAASFLAGSALWRLL